MDPFDKAVSPILMYGCEIWGNDKANDTENFHLFFGKRILKVNTSTMSEMVYVELSRLPTLVKH